MEGHPHVTIGRFLTPRSVSATRTGGVTDIGNVIFHYSIGRRESTASGVKTGMV
ncbi:unnamed protein product, partial [Candidula unifasciata]